MACATAEIINDHEEVVQEMMERKHGHIDNTVPVLLMKAMESSSICRDPDDGIFVECAKDSMACISPVAVKACW